MFLLPFNSITFFYERNFISYAMKFKNILPTLPLTVRNFFTTSSPTRKIRFALTTSTSATITMTSGIGGRILMHPLDGWMSFAKSNFAPEPGKCKNCAQEIIVKLSSAKFDHFCLSSNISTNTFSFVVSLICK